MVDRFLSIDNDWPHKMAQLIMYEINILVDKFMSMSLACLLSFYDMILSIKFNSIKIYIYFRNEMRMGGIENECN